MNKTSNERGGQTQCPPCTYAKTEDIFGLMGGIGWVKTGTRTVTYKGTQQPDGTCRFKDCGIFYCKSWSTEGPNPTDKTPKENRQFSCPEWPREFFDRFIECSNKGRGNKGFNIGL